MIDTTAAGSTECLNDCPLCGGTSWRILAIPGHWIGKEEFRDLQGKLGLVKCRGCGLIFINPRPSSRKLFGFYSGDTYICHEAAGSASAGAKADYLLGRIAECLPTESPRTLLDYGAGGGGFLAHARERGWQIRGYEPGKRGLEACRKVGLDVTDRIDELPQGEFTLVTLHHVFEHLANPIEVLDGIRRLLAPDGRLFIEVPNSRSMRARLAIPFLSRRCRVDERFRAFPIHLMYYSGRTLRMMLKRAGWMVEKTFTIGIGLDEFLIRSEPSLKNTPGSDKPRHVRPSTKRRLRHIVRDVFLDLGMGENLAVIAYPVHH